jgi:C-terminal processing protease CtpA/Prc
VIDLRDNEGGDDCGNNILARLAPRDWSFGQSEERVRFRRTPATLDPYLDTWDEAFRSLGETATATNEGFYRRPSNERSTRLRAKLPRITGPVAALIGPANSSATHQFAERAKQTGWIRLFGTETGGNRRGINGGAFFFVRLPATGLEFDLPLIGYFPHAPQPDAGVVPDVLVPETVDDVINGRDRALDSAVDWILTKSRAERPFAITDARTGQSHGPMSPSAPALLM